MTNSSRSAHRGAASALTAQRVPAGLEVKAQEAARAADLRLDTLYIPAALAALFLLLYLLTATGYHTFDGIAYIRDMGKPLATMVLPHHLIYEPTVLGFFTLWQALGWQGHADLPGEVLSSLAGAGGIAIFYKICWEWSRSRAVALIAALALALSYGYWFYSVEVEIYVPPLFFLLVAAWLLGRAVRGMGRPLFLFWLIGLCHAMAALIHQASLFIIPAFALSIFLIGGNWLERCLRVVRYGAALAGVVLPAYLFTGIVIAGQNTPSSFLIWFNSYGHLGTWGAWRSDSFDATVSGLSAAVSDDFWVGRALVATLLVLVLARAVPITRRGGPFAWTLWAWFGIYFVFFAWWQPENLKFWVLMIPAPLMLAVLAFRWQELRSSWKMVAMAAGVLSVLLLALTDTPTILAKRDPLSDPQRQASAALAQPSSPEDLIVLQAGSIEHYLPFYYDRINVMSTRELWYTTGGANGRQAAIDAIRLRMWHALAKGSNVWLEDRVLTAGEQTSDHYVFNKDEIAQLLSPYGEPVQPERVATGPESFYELSPQNVYSKQTEWRFTTDQAGWSGIDIAGEAVGKSGWCFAPLNDPNLYGPPVRLSAGAFNHIELTVNSGLAGKAQLFYRASFTEPYSESDSLRFDLQKGEKTYSLGLKSAPGWTGTIEDLRFDPVEQGDPGAGAKNNICVESIRLVP